MTNAINGRVQTPEHIAKRVAASIAYQKKRARRSASATANRLAFMAEWRARNADKIKEYQRMYRQKTKAERCAAQMERHARKLSATPPWADRDAVKGMYELCGLFRATGLDLHVDHIFPLQGKTVCGLHVAENMQLLTRWENSRKKNRMPQGVLGA